MRGSFSPLAFLRRDDLPAGVRAHYVPEFRHLVGWGIFAGIVEGNTANIVAIKTFGATPLLTSVVYATPMVANILALLLSAWSRGRPRLPTFVLYAALACVLLASIAVTPADAGAWAGWIFAAQMALCRVFVAGLVTIRTTLWQMHYPQSHRARIAGRLQTLRFFMGLLAAASAALLFDASADFYRFVYPMTALVGALSLLPLRRSPVPAADAAPAATSDEPPSTGMRAALREAWAILRTDRRFARYCSAQYLLGSAAFFLDPLVILFISTKLGFGYFTANLMLDVIPRLITLVSITPFAHYFDRVGVLRFRVVNSAMWLVTFAVTAAAVLLCAGSSCQSLVTSDAWRSLDWRVSSWVAVVEHPGFTSLAAGIGLLVLARIGAGLGQGGGSIAWNLGHLHFSSGHKAEMYMGIHVALTGVRGVMMPFVAWTLLGLMGWWSLLPAIGLGVWALIAFIRLERDERTPETGG